MLLRCQIGGVSMKRIAILLAFVFVLSGCTTRTSLQSGDSHQTEHAVNEFPIVIVDTTNSLKNAYVVCFSVNGVVKTLDNYTCDGKRLRDFLGQDDALKQSAALDLSRSIKLMDNMGSTARIQLVSMQCEERVIDETLVFQVAFEPSLSEENSFYIGTYSELDIFPKEVTRQDNTVQVDLDTDGNMDRIEWSFTPTTSAYGVKNDYAISVNRNGTSYTLAMESHLPLEEADLAVFVADLNGDKEYEIIVYANGMSLFGEVTVYTFTDNQYSINLNRFISGWQHDHPAFHHDPEAQYRTAPQGH